VEAKLSFIILDSREYRGGKGGGGLIKYSGSVYRTMQNAEIRE
jgi:hypothetical protein